MEMDPAGTDRPGPRLADVVEQGGEPENLVGTRLLDHGDGVGEDVLVPLDRVLLERKRRQLREELRRQPRIDEKPQSR